MTTVANLILQANYSQIINAINQLQRLSNQGAQTESVMKRLASQIGLLFSVKQIYDAVETYTRLNNRLSLVTSGTEQFAAAQKQLFEIAQSTNADLETTATLYQRIATNATSLGLTLNEVGKVTELINKTLTISGTSAASADAALIQLGQAFASGTLRGEELNSVLEQAPALAKAIADGLGVTVGQLRSLGAEGKLTATEVINAITKQGDSIDAMFEKMTPTISQSLTIAKNSFTNVVGEMDKMLGASTSLAKAIKDFSRYIDKGSAIDTFSQVLVTWGEAVSNAKREFDGFGITLGTNGKLGQAIDFLNTAFIQLPSNIKTVAQIAVVELSAFIDKSANEASRAKKLFGTLLSGAFTTGSLESGKQMDAVSKQFDTQAEAIDNARDSTINAILAQRDYEIQLGETKKRMRELERELLTDGNVLNEGGGDPAQIKDQKEEERQRKKREKYLAWLEEQRIYWHNEIVDYVDKITQEAEIDNAQFEKKRQDLIDMFATQEELENANYERKLSKLYEYFEVEHIAVYDQKRLLEQEEKAHNERLFKIKQDAESKDQKSLKSKLGYTQSILNNLYTISGSHNDRMLKAAQATGAAISLINAYQSASETLKDPTLPWYARVSAALSVLAAGMGFVNAIRGGGSGGDGGGAVATTPQTSNIQQSAQEVEKSIVDFRVQRRGMRGWSDDDVADLMELIGERVNDGAKFGRVEFLTNG